MKEAGSMSAGMNFRLARLALAIVAATIGGVTLAALGVSIWANCTSPGMSCPGSDTAFALVVGATYGAMIGLPVMVVAGLPIHSFLIKARLRTWLPYALGGAIAGKLGSLAFSASYVTMAAYADSASWLVALIRATAQNLALGMATGVLCASIFWLIRRPDSDQPSAGASKSTSA